MSATPTRVRQLIGGVWKYVTADEDGGGGSSPGTLVVVERTFAQVAGGGHTYTATVDLPDDSRLWLVELSMLTDWDDGADLDWSVGDESDPNGIIAQPLGFASDSATTSAYRVANNRWKQGAPSGAPTFDSFGPKPYPSGQTITAAVTDVTGGTGTAVIRFYYFVAPATAAAVVS